MKSASNLLWLLKNNYKTFESLRNSHFVSPLIQKLRDAFFLCKKNRSIAEIKTKLKMKKLSILLGAALMMGMTFASCSSDDDSSSVSDEALVGKWNYSKIKTSINGHATPEVDYQDNQAGCSADYVELFANGVTTDGDYYDSDCTLDESDGTWTRDGKVITVTKFGTTQDFTVVSVSSSKMKLKATYVEGEFTYVETVTFVKAPAL